MYVFIYFGQTTWDKKSDRVFLLKIWDSRILINLQKDIASKWWSWNVREKTVWQKEKWFEHLTTIPPIGKLTGINMAPTSQIPSSCFFLFFRTQVGNCFDRIFHCEHRKHLSLWWCNAVIYPCLSKATWESWCRTLKYKSNFLSNKAKAYE